VVPDLAEPDYVSIKKGGSGAFQAGLQFNTRKCLSLGAEIVYSRHNTVFNYPNTSTTEIRNQWFIVLAKASFVYHRQEKFLPFVEMYGSVYAGPGFREAKDVKSTSTTPTLNQNYLAYHISPIGIRSGGKIAFWAEAGYGFKGLLCAGMSARF
jgi:hypothetical protein